MLPVAGVALLIFIFSETIPKNIAKVWPDEWACLMSAPLQLIIWILTPVAWLFMGFSVVMRKLFKNSEEGPSMTEDEFQARFGTTPVSRCGLDGLKRNAEIVLQRNQNHTRQESDKK